MTRKTHLILTLFLLQSIACLSQNESMVVVKSGILIRGAASTKANAVGSVRFGEMVQRLDDIPRVKDTVNGMTGNWIKIKHHAATGYVFDAYLGSFIKRNKNFPENYPQLFKLNASCGEEQYFNAELHWYGVFDKGDQFSISLLTLNFSVKSENWTDELYDPYLKIEVSTPEKPIFLIGLPDSIPGYAIQKNEFMSTQCCHLYPGQHFNVGSSLTDQGSSYYLESYGRVEESDSKQPREHFTPSFMRIKDYKINVGQFKNGITKTKNILEDVEQPVIYEGMPNLVFVGDLNFDSVPDMIFSYLTGHASANTYLFMSGYSDKEILTKVALNRWGSCY